MNNVQNLLDKARQVSELAEEIYDATYEMVDISKEDYEDIMNSLQKAENALTNASFLMDID